MIDIEQLRADIAAGTPGPGPMETVRTSCGVFHKIGPWPHKWRHGADMSACIYDDYPSPPEGTDTMLANARRIARVPDLEAAYLAQNERIKALESAISAAERQVRNGRTMAAMHILQDARAALGATK